MVSILFLDPDDIDYDKSADSVSLQSYPNIECVVVAAADDHAPLDPWRGRFPQHRATFDPHLGWGGALAAGLQAATGDFCVIVDSGCFLNPDHVERLIHGMRAQRDRKVVYSDVAVIDGDGATTLSILAAPFDPARLLAENYLPMHAALLSSAALTDALAQTAPESCRTSWDLWLRLLARTDFLRVPGVSATARLGSRGDVASLADSLANSNDHREAISHFLRSCDPSRFVALISAAHEQACRLDPAQRRLESLHAEHRLLARRMGLDTTVVGGEGQGLSADLLLAQLDQLLHRSAELDLVYQSRSWRLTSGLRRLAQRLRATG